MSSSTVVSSPSATTSTSTSATTSTTASATTAQSSTLCSATTVSSSSQAFSAPFSLLGSETGTTTGKFGKKVSDYTTSATTSTLMFPSLCSSILDKLFDGSYKDSVLISCPTLTKHVRYTSPRIANERPTSMEETKADPRIKTNRQIVAEFEDKKSRDAIYQTKELFKTLKQEMKDYQRYLKVFNHYEQIITEKADTLPSEQLVSKELNRNCARFKLQQCELSIVRIDVIYQIEEKYYPNVIQVLKDLDYTWNVKSEIPPIKKRLDKAVADLYEMLLKVEYLEHEILKADVWVQNSTRTLLEHEGYFKYLWNQGLRSVI